MDVKIGESATISCKSSKDTKWLFTDKRSLPHNTNVTTTSRSSLLVIRNLKMENFGPYTCYGFDPQRKKHFVSISNIHRRG